MRVFINPGHHPKYDAGACGNGLHEADVVLKIGERVQRYLQAVGIVTKLFQYDGLRVIAEDANDWKADLFISIHCNAAANSMAHGTETFYWNEGDGKMLAGTIQKQIVQTICTNDRGIKTANFAVLAYTNMPAVLVETAFISNANDANLLVEREDDFARAIARGVTDYVQIKKPLPDVIDAPKSKSGMLSEHFAASEFACHHCGCGADKIHPRLIALLEELRKNIGGKPLHVNSGYRCPIHNANVGGASNSQHMHGTAADIATPAGMNFEQFAWYVKQLPFDGIGFYPPIEKGGASFIHVDVRDGGIGSKTYWEN